MKSRSNRDIYKEDLTFLLKLKASIGRLHNRIHDNLALIAIEDLGERHRGVDFQYTTAGAAGIDITGVNRSGVTTVVAEVKTTLPDVKGTIRGPQKAAIKKDLERLKAHATATNRYLIVLSPTTKLAILKQLKTAVEYPTVTIFNALPEKYSETDQIDE